MEREEAIKILADLTDNLFLHTWEEQYKALHMAIEALTEPINCVKCKHYYETEDDTDVHGNCRMVEVVRCNDCKWYQGVHRVQGHAPCEWFNKQVLWNDFCSNGEPYKGGVPE